MKRGKYFRIVAFVYIDGKSLGDELLKHGLAIKYEGKKKVKDWCE
jgi:endonuclease YncB( thermonuclease family)